MIAASMHDGGKRLAVARISLAYEKASLSIVSSLLVASFVVAVMWSPGDWQSLLAWLLSMCAILMVRYIFIRRFLRLDQSAVELGRWTTGYVISAGATGLCWGLSFFCFPHGTLDQTILLVFLIAGVSAFASVSMATIPLASNVFMLSALLPMALWLSFSDQRSYQIMALASLIHLGLMLLLSRYVHNNVLSYLTSSEHNKTLTLAVQVRETHYRAQYNLLQSVLESAADVSVWALDRDYRYIMFNDKHRANSKRLRGVDIAVGMSALDIIFSKEYRESCHQQFQRVLMGQHLCVEVQEKVAPGDSLADEHDEYYEHHGSPIRNDDGEVVGLTIFSHNITERKQGERALQESLEQISALNRNLEENACALEDQASALEASQVQLMRALDFTEGVINALPDILLEVDRDGRYLNVWTQNPEVAAAQKTALLGKTVHDVLDPQSAAVAMDSIREADLLGVSYGNTLAIVQPTGETRWYEHSLAKKQACEEAPPTFIVLSRDITERKRMEDELRLREREFRTLVDNLPDPFFRYDRDCRPTYVNAQVERLSGRSAASLLGRMVSESSIAAPHWNAILERDIKQVLATGQPLDEELQYQTSDGRTIYYVNRLGPVFDDNGEVSSVMMILHDVSAIKASEQKLKDALAFSEGIINAIPDLLFEVDQAGRYLGIWTQNPALLVSSKSDMLDSSIHEDLSPENAAALMKMIREAEAKGMSAGKPICINLPQGPRWFEHTVSRKPGGTGVDARFLMLSRDVTDRVQAERSLQAYLKQITALNQHLENQAARLEASKAQLQLTEAWYSGVLHAAPDGMLVVNDLGIITLVNAKLGQMFGYAEGELIGQSVELLVPPSARDGHVAKRNGFAGSLSKTSRMAGEAANLRGHRKDGSEFSVDIALSRLPDMNGRAGVICAAIRDVSEQKRLEKALAEREHESRTLIENTPDTIARYNRDGIRIFANQALARSVDGGLDVLLGKRPSEVPGGPQSNYYEATLNEVFATGINTEFELTWPDQNGRDVCSHICLTPEFDASGAVVTVLAVGRDITELHHSRQRIHQMAFYDALTLLPNRALFNDRLRQMLADAQWHAQQAGLMLLDLDRFKAINDSLGHPAGDALLREAARRLTRCVRGYDTVARLGGDEFAILLPDIRAGDDLGRIASKILAAFNEPFMLEHNEVFVSTSIGIAVYPGDSLDADDLIKQGDSAMYFAKRSGRNNFRFYSRDLTASASDRLALESELRRALERNELELYYQPKIRLDDGLLIGSEALLRWNNPQRGLVPPDQFIPVAEDSGMIINIGEWVLRDACRTACDWNGAGKPLHQVAINLSARQFQANVLIETVRKALNATGCQPAWIELEITESLLLDEQGAVLETLETFRDMGISIAIDDFGTGYSSLSYLARFPINTLKIDRSFIRTVTTEHYRAELVKAILSIARCLGQEVVAEGVETLDQAAFLHAHGCQIGQGYLYSKPVPRAAFEAIDWVERFKLRAACDKVA